MGNKVVDENGRVIGEVVNGEVVSLEGEPLGRIVSGRIDGSGKLLSDVTEEVVRDADGNIIGRVVNGQVLDESGKVIGVVKDGVAMSLDGETLGEIGAIKQSASNRFIGFIAGGKGKDGVNPVQRLLVE
ncbi:MAG: hypothetical protein ACI9OO_000212 [Bacteroidia bacterium]|jgi:hypothetical protein